jgi:hypothetical protein
MGPDCLYTHEINTAVVLTQRDNKRGVVLLQVIFGLYTTEIVVYPYLFTAVVCPSLNAPENGKKDTEDLQFEGVTSFSCFPGYYLVGDKNTTCNINGQWDIRYMPSCKGKPKVITVYLS